MSNDESPTERETPADEWLDVPTIVNGEPVESRSQYRVTGDLVEFRRKPTRPERGTPADREGVARVLRAADRPDVPAHLPPSRNYVDMATALMERFTITDGGGSR